MSDNPTPREKAERAATLLEQRASMSRLGKSLTREMDQDILAMREAARAIRGML